MSDDSGGAGEDPDDATVETTDRGRRPKNNGGVLAPLRRFWNVEEGPLVLVRDLLSSALMVLLVAGLLFGVSGVWPPMVAVKSGSMNPHMQKGDLVFVTEAHRFAGGAAVEGTGVVPTQAGRDVGYRKFGKPGDVIVYRPNNDTGRDPIIHRAMFYVEAGENWYDEANQSHVEADDCTELSYCPAPNAGFITKGDNPGSNRYYDQARRMSRPVKPAWIEAKAMVRIPGLGWIRLKWAQMQATAVAAAGLLVVGGATGNRVVAGS